jgi:hypothetical protein
MIMRQRSQLVFAQAMYDEVRSENVRLKEIVSELRARLLAAGIPGETYLTDPKPDQAQMLLPIFSDVP